jgi:hypothetical protein
MMGFTPSANLAQVHVLMERIVFNDANVSCNEDDAMAWTAMDGMEGKIRWLI